MADTQTFGNVLTHGQSAETRSVIDKVRKREKLRKIHDVSRLPEHLRRMITENGGLSIPLSGTDVRVITKLQQVINNEIHAQDGAHDMLLAEMGTVLSNYIFMAYLFARNKSLFTPPEIDLLARLSTWVSSLRTQLSYSHGVHRPGEFESVQEAVNRLLGHGGIRTRSSTELVV